MKFSKLILAFSLIGLSFAVKAQVGIGTNSPAASAQLEVSSTNKGLLIPQIALTGSTDATTITNPASSLLVYNTATTSDVVKGYYYNSGTSESPVWLRLNTGASGVPYNGATGGVDLGAYDLKVNGLSIGRGANQSITTNTAIGSEALADALTADYATAVGFKALNKNSGGFSYGNSAFGAQALLNNQNGPRNTAIGFSSLERNVGGYNNTAVGVNSLYAVVNGGNNTAIGDNTLYINTGSNNTAIGASADVSSASLTNATAIGFDAKVGASNSIQLGNANVTNVKSSGTLTAGTVIYPNEHNSTAGQVLTTNAAGVASWATPTTNGVPYTGATGAVDLGTYDLKVNGITIGLGAGQIASNIAFGNNALNANNTGANLIGIGNNTLMGVNDNSNLGLNNIAIGNNAVFGGTYNIGIGKDALKNNSYRGNSPQTDVGNRNIAIGEASQNIGTGNDNITLGYKSMANNNGYLKENVAIGTQALYQMGGYHSDYVSGGGQNTVIGYQSAYTNRFGVHNTFLGWHSGYSNSDGNNNTAIGYQADFTDPNLTNATSIGNGASVATSNTIQLGNTDVTNVKTSGKLTSGTVTYPNTHGSAGQVLSTTGSGTLTWTTASSDIHSIGEAYGGGIVFYVYDGGKHGLIASAADQGVARWSANGNSTRARADGVGAGVINTAIIIANQGPIDNNSFAATLCSEYSVTTDGVKYGGWYLPSKEELQLLFNQKSILTGLNGSWYYSSTETTDLTTPTTTRAWLISANGASSSWWRQDKSEAWSVRAIRSF